VCPTVPTSFTPSVSAFEAPRKTNHDFNGVLCFRLMVGNLARPGRMQV